MLTVQQLESLDAIRQQVGTVENVHEIHPRAYVVLKDGPTITVQVPEIDSKRKGRYHKCLLYRDLEVGDFCYFAHVDLSDAPTQWVAAPLVGID